MSTPGSPLLVTPANGMATSHANMPPRHDPLIPFHLTLERHMLTRRSSKKPLLILSYLTRALVENVISSVLLLILTLTFQIITDFPRCLFVPYCVSSPARYLLQHFSLLLDISLMHDAQCDNASKRFLKHTLCLYGTFSLT